MLLSLDMISTAIDVSVLSDGAADAAERVVENVAFRFRGIVRIPMAGGWPAAFRAMAAALDGSSSLVAVLSDRVSVSGDAWVWEAIRRSSSTTTWPWSAAGFTTKKMS